MCGEKISLNKISIGKYRRPDGLAVFVCPRVPEETEREIMNSNLNKSPEPRDASRCDLCGQCEKSVRPRTLVTVRLQSGTVRTKFCDQGASAVDKRNYLGPTIEQPKPQHSAGAPPFGERTLITLLNRPLTPAEGEQVTRHLVENAAERDLPRLLEKYRAIERRSGRRIQVCITDYDETTYNFFHTG